MIVRNNKKVDLRQVGLILTLLAVVGGVSGGCTGEDPEKGAGEDPEKGAEEDAEEGDEEGGGCKGPDGEE